MTGTMEERPWLSADPKIETECDGCDLQIPEVLYEAGYSHSAHIFDREEDELIGKWEFCGNCFGEVESFSQEVLDLSEQEGRDDCGFCGDAIDNRWSFAYAPTYIEDFEATMLCEGCQTVMANFLDGVPEESHDTPDPRGETYYPDTLQENPVRTHIDEVDEDSLATLFRDLEPGDEVYLEAHWSGASEGLVDEYICTRGQLKSKKDSGIAGIEAEFERTGEMEGFWVRQEEPAEFLIELLVGVEGDSLWFKMGSTDGTSGRRTTGTVTVLDQVNR